MAKPWTVYRDVEFVPLSLASETLRSRQAKS
jgi:hypothetical protein